MLKCNSKNLNKLIIEGRNLANYIDSAMENGVSRSQAIKNWNLKKQFNK